LTTSDGAACLNYISVELSSLKVNNESFYWQENARKRLSTSIQSCNSC